MKKVLTPDSAVVTEQVGNPTDPAIDLEAAKRFLAALDSRESKFWFQTYDDRAGKKDLRLAKLIRGSLDDVGEEMRALNAKGAAVSVGINYTGDQPRKNENVTRFRAVWCDYDGDKQDSPLNLEDLKFPLRPSAVVQTSNKNFHFYWFVKYCGPNEFRKIMARLVDTYSADRAATDAARALRLPGFFHHKREPFRVRLLDANGKVYHRNDLIESFPALERPTFQLQQRAPEASDLDWAEEAGKLESALKYVPAEDRDLWFKFGAALYDASQGANQGFEIWDEWARSCPGKYRFDDQLQYWREEFDKDRTNRARLASIYFEATRNGWPGLHVKSEIEAKKAHIMRGGELTTKTVESLLTSFAKFGHRPANNQIQALRDVAATLEVMADGELPVQYYLSALAPGMGKTQTIIHFVKHLLASEKHRDVAVIIFLGRLGEIKTLAAQVGLSSSDFSIFVNETPDNERLNALGNQSKTAARVMFTTQQMLESRTRTKFFADLSEFQYNGKARSVRIWDEAILPARAVCVNVSMIEGLTNVVAKSRPQLHKVISDLITEVKKQRDKGLVRIPDFEEHADVDLNEALGIFEEEKLSIRKTVNDLWSLAGRTVVVRQERGGNTLLDYENTLPQDIKPIVVTDASGTVRKTYPHWSNRRGDLVQIAHADKDYSNLTVHVWRRGGGKQAIRDNFLEIIDGIVATINTRAEEDWLVIHHKTDKSKFPNDIPAELRRRTKARLHFLHWGDHSATNEYRDVKNVVLAGTLFYEPSYYEAVGRLSRGMKSDEELKQKDYEEIVSGEHAHLILQALCRGSVRKSEDNKCAPCDAYIIADPRRGIQAMLEDGTIFPGCKVVNWLPLPIKLNGKVGKAFDYIVGELKKHPSARVSFKAVREHLKMGSDTSAFSKEIMSHSDFEGALADKGIIVDRKRGSGGSGFKSRPMPDESPF